MSRQGGAMDIATVAHVRRLREFAATLPGRRSTSLAQLLAELTPGQAGEARVAVLVAAFELLQASRTGRPIPLPGGGSVDARTLLADPAAATSPALLLCLLLADR